ncbi:MAG TPA: hypothetical protein P5108_00695 [Marmoricola sp.]|nr:hypothetical protein [Marmoricola sp.]
MSESLEQVMSPITSDPFHALTVTKAESLSPRLFVTFNPLISLLP